MLEMLLNYSIPLCIAYLVKDLHVCLGSRCGIGELENVLSMTAIE